VHSLKGKTVCHGELHVKSNLSPIPREILSLYREVTLCVDIMYVTSFLSCSRFHETSNLLRSSYWQTDKRR
jgi:hypothetical protein